MLTQNIKIMNQLVVYLQLIKPNGITETVYMNPKSISFSNFNKYLPENPSSCILEIDNACVFQEDAKKVKFVESKGDNSLYSSRSTMHRFNLKELIERAYSEGTPISITIDTTNTDYILVNVY